MHPLWESGFQGVDWQGGGSIGGMLCHWMRAWKHAAA
jgi:hypothetical protein